MCVCVCVCHFYMSVLVVCGRMMLVTYNSTFGYSICMETYDTTMLFRSTKYMTWHIANSGLVPMIMRQSCVILNTQ